MQILFVFFIGLQYLCRRKRIPMKTTARIVVFLLLFVAGVPRVCTAQVNIQLLYDCGVTPLTTVEMYKGDAWGDTYFFIDHYYHTNRLNGQINIGMDSYLEFERGLNFWHETILRDLNLHLGYGFSSAGTMGYGHGMACIGAKYSFHNDSFSRTAGIALMYDHYIGYGSADIPLKLTGTWNVENLFSIRGLICSGFIDVWVNNTEYVTDQMGIGYDHFSIHTQPQLWIRITPNLCLGGEAVVAYNHFGTHGFSCHPNVGLKWAF